MVVSTVVSTVVSMVVLTVVLTVDLMEEGGLLDCLKAVTDLFLGSDLEFDQLVLFSNWQCHQQI
jgi:hypothetical protein